MRAVSGLRVNAIRAVSFPLRYCPVSQRQQGA